MYITPLCIAEFDKCKLEFKFVDPRSREAKIGSVSSPARRPDGENTNALNFERLSSVSVT